MTDDSLETQTHDPAPEPIAEPEPAPVTAKTKLRAFEDDVFGEKVGRINGDIERGIGSPYAAMTPHQQAHYAALEKLVAAEKGMADASATLAAAEAAHAAAAKTAADAEQASADSA